eukprot:1156050-Pelagomonas_calceolata.AAC.3
MRRAAGRKYEVSEVASVLDHGGKSLTTRCCEGCPSASNGHQCQAESVTHTDKCLKCSILFPIFPKRGVKGTERAKTLLSLGCMLIG